MKQGLCHFRKNGCLLQISLKKMECQYNLELEKVS